MKLDESQICMVNAQNERPNAQFVGSTYTHATHENHKRIRDLKGAPKIYVCTKIGIIRIGP